MAAESCSMTSGHTLGKGFGRPAKPGVGSQQDLTSVSQGLVHPIMQRLDLADWGDEGNKTFSGQEGDHSSALWHV